MMRTLIVCLLCVFALSASASAAPISCLAASSPATNVLSPSLAMGCFGGAPSLIFDTFSVVSTGTSTIFLSAGTAATANGFNLGFQITTTTPPIDTLFQYRVSTADGLAEIVGVDNQQSGVNTTIGELVCAVQPNAAGVCPAGQVIVNFANPSPPGGTVNATFSARSVVWIVKDISEPTANSFISSFVNSQTTGVPEPSTVLLLCAGMLGMAGIRKKLRRE